MTQERAPERERSLVGEEPGTTAWEVARDRLANPEDPNAPTAGPPPYTIFRIVPSKVFGLPGIYGMDQFDQADPPRPTRWDFGSG
jgi:hypothetical protein